MGNLTFCINTTTNEKPYVELLLRSMETNFSRKDYPIIVFVDADNQGTVDYLKTQKSVFPRLKIVVNPLPVPLYCGINSNYMFELAETDIVSYLQSDMVVCKNYDLEIVKDISDDTIISSTRIEPPLHGPSPEKIVSNLGILPSEFNFNEFINLSENIKSQNRPLTDFWFAPFTFHRKHWVDIGGYDTHFRRTRGDSDIVYRFCLNNLNLKQSWKAIVYHFTCTSSRGFKWWEADKERNKVIEMADMVDLKRFIKKWGRFKHDSRKYDPNVDYKYNISLNLINSPVNRGREIFDRYFLFNKIHVDNVDLRSELEKMYENEHLPANILTSFSNQQWAYYKKYQKVIGFSDIFPDKPVNDDITITIECEKFLKTDSSVINNLQAIVNQLKSEEFEPGVYDCNGLEINFNSLNNVIRDNIICRNPSVEDLDFVVY